MEHKFAVSNVELEGGDRGMKMVVQIVCSKLCKICAPDWGPDCGPGLEGLTLPAGEENAAQYFGKA